MTTETNLGRLRARAGATWVAAALVAVLSTWAPATAAPLSAVCADETARVVERVMRPRSGDEARADDQVVQALVELGPGAIPSLFAIVCGDAPFAREPGEEEQTIPGVGWGDAEHRSRLALEALGGLHAPHVIAHLESHAGVTARGETRLAAIRVLGRLGSEQGLQHGLRLATSLEGPALRSNAARSTVAPALSEILRRDQESWDTLEHVVAELSPAVRDVVLDAVELSARPEAARFLSVRLGASSKSDERLLDALVNLGKRYPWRVDAEARTRVRLLLGHKQPRTRRVTAVALGRIADTESIGPLIDRLEDTDPRVQRAALWSLQELSGLEHLKSVDDWRHWFTRETAWVETEVPRLRQDLRSDEPAQVLRAVRELARTGPFRDQAAEILCGAAGDVPPDVAVAVCEALVRLNALRAVPRIPDLLLEPEPRVVAAALRALQELTGEDLPADAMAWINWVQG